jgi:hypothetical protein
VESRSSLLRDSGLELGSKVLPNSDSELCSGVLHNLGSESGSGASPDGGPGLRDRIAAIARAAGMPVR